MATPELASMAVKSALGVSPEDLLKAAERGKEGLGVILGSTLAEPVLQFTRKVHSSS